MDKLIRHGADSRRRYLEKLIGDVSGTNPGKQHSAPLAQALRALLSDTPTLMSLGVVLLLIAGLIMVRHSPATLVAIGTLYDLAPEVCSSAVAVQIFFCCALLATVTVTALRMHLIRSAMSSLLSEQRAVTKQQENSLHELLQTYIPARFRLVGNLDAGYQGGSSSQLIETEDFELVTVLFCSFEKLAVDETQDAGMHLRHMSWLVLEFDCILQEPQYSGLFKLENVGQDYIVTSSVLTHGTNDPDEYEDSLENRKRDAVRLVQLAQDFLRISDVAHEALKYKVGLHSGPAIGAVCGRQRRFYRLFGDTINTAARMCSHAEPDGIQISETTNALLKDSHVVTQHRGRIEVKGKGRMHTYRVDIPDLDALPPPGIAHRATCAHTMQALRANQIPRFRRHSIESLVSWVAGAMALAMLPMNWMQVSALLPARFQRASTCLHDDDVPSRLCSAATAATDATDASTPPETPKKSMWEAEEASDEDMAGALVARCNSLRVGSSAFSPFGPDAEAPARASKEGGAVEAGPMKLASSSRGMFALNVPQATLLTELEQRRERQRELLRGDSRKSLDGSETRKRLLRAKTRKRASKILVDEAEDNSIHTLHFITCTFASEEMEDRYNGSMHSRRLSEQRLYMKAVRRAVVLLASSLCALDLFPRSIQTVSTIGAVMFCLYAVPVTSKGSAASRRAPGQPRQAAHMEPYLYSHIHLACTFLFPLLALDLPAPIVLTAITMHSVAAPPTEPVIHGLTRFPAAVLLTAALEIARCSGSSWMTLLTILTTFLVTLIFIYVPRYTMQMDMRILWQAADKLRKSRIDLAMHMYDLVPSVSACNFVMTMQMSVEQDGFGVVDRDKLWTSPLGDTACILSTDLANFTQLSMRLGPHGVVNLLHDMWCCMDAALQLFQKNKRELFETEVSDVFEQTETEEEEEEDSLQLVAREASRTSLLMNHSLEPFKVDTVGDAYVVAIMLDHPTAEMQAASVSKLLDVAKAIADNVQMYSNSGPQGTKPGEVQMRMGLCLAPARSGLVGLTKPRYHIVGEALVQAATLESMSSAFHVYVDEHTSDLVPFLRGNSVVDLRVQTAGSLISPLQRRRLSQLKQAHVAQTQDTNEA